MNKLRALFESDKGSSINKSDAKTLSDAVKILKTLSETVDEKDAQLAYSAYSSLSQFLEKIK